MIQSSGPLRHATVEGMDARDIRVHNYPPGWNADAEPRLAGDPAQSQTGAVSLDPLRWGIIPYWREDPEQGAPRFLTPLYPLHVNLPMSAWSQTRTSEDILVTSAHPSTTDRKRTLREVCHGP